METAWKHVVYFQSGQIKNIVEIFSVNCIVLRLIEEVVALSYMLVKNFCVNYCLPCTGLL